MPRSCARSTGGAGAPSQASTFALQTCADFLGDRFGVQGRAFETGTGTLENLEILVRQLRMSSLQVDVEGIGPASHVEGQFRSRKIAVLVRNREPAGPIYLGLRSALNPLGWL